MFCDGICTKKGKKCGLLTEIIMENKMAGEIKTVEICVFKASFESQLRAEQGNIRLQAAIESKRNEEVKTGLGIQDALNTGFLKTLPQRG